MERIWEYAVVVHFWTFQDSGSQEIGRVFLETLAKFGFQPNKFGDQDPPKHRLDSTSASKVLHEWVKRPGQLILERMGENGFQALLHLSQPQNRPVLVTFALPDSYFASASNVSKFLEFSEELYAIFKPFQGDISHKREWDEKIVAITPVKIGSRTVKVEAHMSPQPTRGLPGIFWANFFGPNFVNFYSKAKLESAPSYSKKELPDGGYLILTSPSPLDYSRPEMKRTEEDLIEYLGRDTVFDKASPDRVLRSPFTNGTGQHNARNAISPLPSSIPSNPAYCPKCGEQRRIEETSRDRINRLVGFTCLTCGAIWAVHGALLQAPSKNAF